MMSGNQATVDLVIQHGASLTEKGVISGKYNGYLLMANALGFAAELGDDKMLA